MADRLKGKVAVVTGAGRGLGRCHALALAAEGAKLVINDLGGAVDGSGAAKGPADEVVEEIKKMGGEAVANYDSVNTFQAGENIIKTAVDSFGTIDILVNNAGVLRDRMVFNMSDEEWDTVLKVHLYGHFNTTKNACLVMRQQKSGRIVNTSSVAGLGNMGQANYSAAKEGIVGLTRTVAIDMGRYGVTCNAIRPLAGTRMTLTPELFEAWKKRGMTEEQIRGMFPGPEDVSPMVVFLCTAEAANINGRTFDVGGGNIGLYTEPENFRSIFKAGMFTLDEVCDLIPKTLARGLQNPSPPAAPKE